MIRFFARLAIATLADWLTWRISTPEMRQRRIIRKYYGRLGRILEATTPAVQEFGETMRRTSEAFVRLAQEWEIK